MVAALRRILVTFDTDPPRSMALREDMSDADAARFIGQLGREGILMPTESGVAFMPPHHIRRIDLVGVSMEDLREESAVVIVGE